MRDLILAFHLRAIARMLEKDPEALHQILGGAAARSAATPRPSRFRWIVGAVRGLFHRRPKS